MNKLPSSSNLAQQKEFILVELCLELGLDSKEVSPLLENVYLHDYQSFLEEALLIWLDHWHCPYCDKANNYDKTKYTGGVVGKGGVSPYDTIHEDDCIVLEAFSRNIRTKIELIIETNSRS